jgi:hypothetical protein
MNTGRFVGASVAVWVVRVLLNGALHQFFAFAFLSVGLTSIEVIFQMIAHAIEGAVAGAIYKSSPA